MAASAARSQARRHRRCCSPPSRALPHGRIRSHRGGHSSVLQRVSRSLTHSESQAEASLPDVPALLLAAGWACVRLLCCARRPGSSRGCASWPRAARRAGSGPRGLVAERGRATHLAAPRSVAAPQPPEPAAHSMRAWRAVGRQRASAACPSSSFSLAARHARRWAGPRGCRRKLRRHPDCRCCRLAAAGGSTPAGGWTRRGRCVASRPPPSRPFRAGARESAARPSSPLRLSQVLLLRQRMAARGRRRPALARGRRPLSGAWHGEIKNEERTRGDGQSGVRED